MNKSNRGKQRKQKNTIIPMNNMHADLGGKPQKITTDTGKAKGLKQVLEECGFDVTRMTAKCSPVCCFKNEKCCMAHLLSKQDNFITSFLLTTTIPSMSPTQVPSTAP